MKGFFASIIGVALFIIVTGLLTRNLQEYSQNQNAHLNPGLPRGYVRINNIRIDVEIALTPEAKSLGLANRSSLGQYFGMLFPYDPPAKTRYWMKDMVFPIDILWIKDAKILRIDENALPPAKDTPEEKLKLYFSPGEVDHVLELNAFFCRNNNIKTGDKLEYFLPETDQKQSGL